LENKKNDQRTNTLNNIKQNDLVLKNQKTKTNESLNDLKNESSFNKSGEFSDIDMSKSKISTRSKHSRKQEDFFDLNINKLQLPLKSDVSAISFA
jgi:hypothetical protein